MATNPPGPLTRANYLSPLNGPVVAIADPNSASYDPANVTPLDGPMSYRAAARDTELYHRTLERLHGTGLHGAGIAGGLQLTCSIQNADIVVAPGVALDGQGRHIYLAVGGQAGIGAAADVPDAPSALVPVTEAGATVPTGGLVGDLYVIVQWRETLNGPVQVSDPNLAQYEDTPWLRLIAAAALQPDVHVVLGKVSLDADGAVTALSHGDVGGLQRTSINVPAQSLELRRAVTPAAQGADTAAWASIRAREAGGIELDVQRATDQIAMQSSAGGLFSMLAVGAQTASFGDVANPGISLRGDVASIELRRDATPEPWASIEARAAGGIELDVKNAGDQIAMQTTAGGMFSVLTVGAQTANFGAVASPGISLRGDVATIELRRDATPAAWASIEARAAGGIELDVKGASDQIAMQTAAGGMFSALTVGARSANFGDVANPGISLRGDIATIEVGVPGNYGDVLVHDGAGKYAVSLVGDTGHVVVGGPNTDGKVRVLKKGAAETLHLDGATGSAVVQRLQPFSAETLAIDVDARFFRMHGVDLTLDGRSGNNCRALSDTGGTLTLNFGGDYANGVEIQGSGLRVDGRLVDGQGVSLMGNPVSKSIQVEMFASPNSGRVTSQVDLGFARPFTASCTIASINSTDTFDGHSAAYAEVYSVDGVPTTVLLAGNGSNFGPPGDPRNMHWPYASGFGRIVVFAVNQSGPHVDVVAVGQICYE